MKVSEEEGVTSEAPDEMVSNIDTGRSVTVTDRTTRHSDRTTQHSKHGTKKTERQSEMSMRGQRRLKKLRRIYQAEIGKNLAFFQSARPYIELGSKPLSVQAAPLGTNGQGEKGDAMEQLD